MKLNLIYKSFFMTLVIPIVRFIFEFKILSSIIISYAVTSIIFVFVFSPLIHFSENTWKIKKSTAEILFGVCCVLTVLFLVPNVIVYFTDFSKDSELFGSTFSMLFGPPFVIFAICSFYLHKNLKSYDSEDENKENKNSDNTD